eukprot:3021509-Ditylum_brightwellii.AAC.1
MPADKLRTQFVSCANRLMHMEQELSVFMENTPLENTAYMKTQRAHKMPMDPKYYKVITNQFAMEYIKKGVSL